MADTIHLTSDGAPNGVGEHWWADTKTVVAVPEKLALDLLHIQNGGFHQAESYKALPVRPAPVEAIKPIAKPRSLVDSLTVPATEQPDEQSGLETALDLVAPKGTRSAKKG